MNNPSVVSPLTESPPLLTWLLYPFLRIISFSMSSLASFSKQLNISLILDEDDEIA